MTFPVRWRCAALRRRLMTLASPSLLPADSLTLAPFKDDLFAYPGILSTGDGGAYTVVDYREMRDINGRDEIPERRAQRQICRRPACAACRRTWC